MRGKQKIEIDNDKLQIASEKLRALAHPLRMKILEFIDQNEGIDFPKIHETLKLESHILSQHLRVLRISDMVETHRRGKFIRYSVNYKEVKKCIKSVNYFLEEEY